MTAAMSADEFVRGLAAYRKRISKPLLKTLRGQALAGDVDGAMRGLKRILERSDKSMKTA